MPTQQTSNGWDYLEPEDLAEVYNPYAKEQEWLKKAVEEAHRKTEKAWRRNGY